DSGLAALRLILVVRDKEYDAYNLKKLVAWQLAREVEVKDLRRDRFDELAREFLIRKRYSPGIVDRILALEKAARDEDPTLLKDPWSISELPMVFNSYASRFKPRPAGWGDRHVR